MVDEKKNDEEDGDEGGGEEKNQVNIGSKKKERIRGFNSEWAFLRIKDFEMFNQPIFILASSSGYQFNGMIGVSLMQVSSFPPRIAVSISNRNLTCEYVKKSGAFSLSFLEKTAPTDLVNLFGLKSGRDTDKFAGVKYVLGETGLPLVKDHTFGAVEVKVVASLELDDCTVFVGKVLGATKFSDAEPLLYREVLEKSTRLPPTAPPVAPIGAIFSFSAPGDTKKYDEIEKELAQKAYFGWDAVVLVEDEPVEAYGRPNIVYVCTVCGFEYNYYVGDPEQDVAPGTHFGDLPEDWVCPSCGAGKRRFSIKSHKEMAG